MQRAEIRWSEPGSPSRFNLTQPELKAPATEPLGLVCGTWVVGVCCMRGTAAWSGSRRSRVARRLSCPPAPIQCPIRPAPTRAARRRQFCTRDGQVSTHGIASRRRAKAHTAAPYPNIEMEGREFMPRHLRPENSL
jgi:hypothetical protein